MKQDQPTDMAHALRILANDIQSPDDVPAMLLRNAADMIELLDASGIHTCHDRCMRPNCVLRRELKLACKQRDRMSVALREIDAACFRIGRGDVCDVGVEIQAIRREAIEALASVNEEQPKPKPQDHQAKHPGQTCHLCGAADYACDHIPGVPF